MDAEQLNRIAKAMQAANEQLLKMAEHAMKAAYALYEAVRAEYRAQGAPHGDTDEGMMRWLDELSAVTAARNQAEYEHELQWVSDDFRQRLADRRN